MSAARLVPLAGVAAVVLVVVGAIVGGETPDADASVAKVVSFYREHDTDQVVGGLLMAWGTAMFLLFASGLWRILRGAEAAERRGASTLAVVGMALMAAGIAVLAGIGFTLGDVADDLQPSAIQALNALSADLFFPISLGVFAFLMGVGASALRSGALPRWLAWVSAVLAVVAITPAGFFVFLALGLWILLVSALIALGRVGTAEGAAAAGP